MRCPSEPAPPVSRSPQGANFATLSGVSRLSHSTGCPATAAVDVRPVARLHRGTGSSMYTARQGDDFASDTLRAEIWPPAWEICQKKYFGGLSVSDEAPTVWGRDALRKGQLHVSTGPCRVLRADNRRSLRARPSHHREQTPAVMS